MMTEITAMLNEKNCRPKRKALFLAALALLPLLLFSCGEKAKTGAPAPAGERQLSTASATTPAAPAEVAAAAGSGEVTLSWTPVADAASYTVYYLTHAGVTPANGKQRTMAVSGEPITGLENTVTYYFRVTATNGAGESEASVEVAARPMPALPGIPGSVKLEGGLGEATLSWQAVPYATSYTVYYGTTPGLALRLGAGLSGRSVNLTTTKYTDLLDAPGHYYFIVTASNASGEGAPSKELAAVAKSAYKAVAAGDGFSSAVRTMEPMLKVDGGAVWVWGNNSNYELGTGGQPLQTSTAMQVPTINAVTSISGGAWHSVVLKTDSSVWDWGANSRGQLGFRYSTTNQAVPVQATLYNQVMTSVAAGWEHTVALKEDGTVWTWGHNQMGGLGYAAPDCYDPNIVGYTCSLTPTKVPGITTEMAAIAAGELHTLAVAKNGTSVWAWGRNTTGQLGTDLYAFCPDGVANPDEYGFKIAEQTTRYSCSTKPVEVIFPKDVIAVSAGTYHSVALMRDGTVFAWGGNWANQLGYEAPRQCQIQAAVIVPCSTEPTEVPGLDHIIAISAGAEHTLALKNDGTVWAWGRNNKGQLGNDVELHSDLGNGTPTQVEGLTGIIAIAAGKYHSVALKNNGTAWAWGYNNHGQLGNGSDSDSTAPVQVQGLLGPVVIIPGM